MAEWFPYRHPEHVRAAQIAAVTASLATTAASIMFMMALGLAVQVQRGFDWAAAAWQGGMGAFMYLVAAEWSHRRNSVPREPVEKDSRQRLTFFSALLGIWWTAGLLVWTRPAQAQLALTAVAVSMIYILYTAASRYFVPWAVVAFSVPLVVGSIAASLLELRTPVAQAAVLLIAIHSLVSLRLLRKNWGHFARTIEMDLERTRLSAMLHEQKEIAEGAVQLKTRFLASASHDLRQPMHAISLYLDGLADADLPERIRAAIIDARICAHDMNDMFRSLLDISRLDAQQAIPTLGTFNIGAVLSRVEKEFQQLAASRGVRLTVRRCSDHVYSDPVMVERIALNFVSNAVRHTSIGRVLVACRVRGRVLRLAVYDTGKGIPESQQQAIFEEFHRLDTSRPHDNTGGLGLGLAIVRRLAQALRLRVQVRSTPGRGSMFAIDLPLVHVTHSTADAAESGPRLAGRLVVVVDDEASILQAMSFILESCGCVVIAARSGREAIASLVGSTRVPDFLVCDYELGEKQTGLDVIQQLREEFNTDIPAMLVTGNTTGGVADKSARELAIPVLYKPLEAAVLRSSLEGLLVAEER